MQFCFIFQYYILGPLSLKTVSKLHQRWLGRGGYSLSGQFHTFECGPLLQTRCGNDTLSNFSACFSLLSCIILFTLVKMQHHKPRENAQCSLLSISVWGKCKKIGSEHRGVMFPCKTSGVRI